jgi:hypothetical protein
MATAEEYEAAAERIKLGLYWDHDQNRFFCFPAAIDLMAKGAVDAAERVRSRRGGHAVPARAEMMVGADYGDA